jgi:hypothetical protein
MDILKILENWAPQHVQSLVSSLNTDGIVSDQEDDGLSSTMIEGWTGECEQFIRSKGYTGGKVAICGDFFPGYGAIYALYDTSLMTREEALKYVKSVSERPI